MGLSAPFNGPGSPDVSRRVHNLTRSSGNKNYSHWPDVGNSRVVCKTFRKCYVNAFLEFKQVSWLEPKSFPPGDLSEVCKNLLLKSNSRFLLERWSRVWKGGGFSFRKKVTFHSDILMTLYLEPWKTKTCCYERVITPLSPWHAGKCYVSSTQMRISNQRILTHYASWIWS